MAVRHIPVLTPGSRAGARGFKLRGSMFKIDLTVGAMIYTGFGILVIAGLAIWADRRDRAFYDSTRRRTTFHCLKCNRVYTSAESHEVCKCPVCGHENPRLKF